MSESTKSIDAYPIKNLPKAWQDWVRFMGCGNAKDARIEWFKGHSGTGWYVYCAEYPEEGCVYLSKKTPENVQVYHHNLAKTQ